MAPESLGIEGGKFRQNCDRVLIASSFRAVPLIRLQFLPAALPARVVAAKIDRDIAEFFRPHPPARRGQP